MEMGGNVAAREDVADLLSEGGGELLQSRHSLRRFRSGVGKVFKKEL